MNYSRKCPKCNYINESEHSYCSNCGINIDKYYDEEQDREPGEQIYKPKKGSFDKKFLRGMTK